MSVNLLIWKWSSDYDTPAKRRKLKGKFGDVTSTFAKDGDSPAFVEYEIGRFLDAVNAVYRQAAEERPFVLEEYERCLNFSIPNSARLEVVSTIGRIAMAHGLNASEF